MQPVQSVQISSMNHSNYNHLPTTMGKKNQNLTSRLNTHNFHFNLLVLLWFLASQSMTFGGTYPQCQRRQQQEVLPDTTLQYSYWATSTSSPDNMISGI